MELYDRACIHRRGAEAAEKIVLERDFEEQILKNQKLGPNRFSNLYVSLCVSAPLRWIQSFD
jgi:hypothetical protein